MTVQTSPFDPGYSDEPSAIHATTVDDAMKATEAFWGYRLCSDTLRTTPWAHECFNQGNYAPTHKRLAENGDMGPLGSPYISPLQWPFFQIFRHWHSSSRNHKKWYMNDWISTSALRMDSRYPRRKVWWRVQIHLWDMFSKLRPEWPRRIGGLLLVFWWQKSRNVWILFRQEAHYVSSPWHACIALTASQHDEGHCPGGQGGQSWEVPQCRSFIKKVSHGEGHIKINGLESISSNFAPQVHDVALAKETGV